MTQLDERLLAREKLLQAIAPWLSEDALADAAATLRADLVAARDPQERLVLKRALLLLANGAARFGTHPPAAWLEDVLRATTAQAAKSAKDFP
jgi:hypothetical protein